MFEQVKQLVQQYAGDSIVNNSAVPNDKNEHVIDAASHTIVDTIKSKLSGGSLGDMQSMLSNEGSQGLTSELTNTFTTKLGALGLGADTANSIGSSLFPTLINKVKDMFMSGNGGFDMGSLMSGLSGMTGNNQSEGQSQQGGLGDLAKGLGDKLGF